VKDGDTAYDIAIGFRDLILSRLNNDGYIDSTGSQTGDSAFSVGGLMQVVTGGNATSVQFQFRTGMNVGSAAISFDVVQIDLGERFFSATDAATNYYGSLQLQSLSDQPITIQLGESAVLAQHGFFEQNIGDIDFNPNAASSFTAVSGLTVSTSEAASEAIAVLDAALEKISDYRSNLGALENRLGHTISNLSNVVENTAASQSRILDADFAVEAANLARAQILQQAGSAMLAQANAAPQNVLSLLG